jgi:hypothetical protein
MDAFEVIVADIAARQGYWVRPSVWIELTDTDRAELTQAKGTPVRQQRVNLDVVGYNGRDNEVLVIECKSFIDSEGVRYGSFLDGGRHAYLYKLFTEPTWRNVVLNRLRINLERSCAPGFRFTLGLACGKIYAGDEPTLVDHFARHNWCLWTPGWLRQRLIDMGRARYENNVGMITAKLLLRDQP